MADNEVTQTTVATLPTGMRIATVQGTHSGDTDAHAGLEVLAVSSGAEGSRTLTMIDPRGGDVAHDGADSGNPVKMGAKAVAFASVTGVSAAADRTDLLANRSGVLFTLGGHPAAKSATYLWTASTTDDNVLPAIAGGTKYAITRLTVFIDQACTVGVAVRLGFGTASVPTLPSANADAVDDILAYHPGLVPGTGFNIGDGSGVIGVGGDGAELRITAGVTTGGTGVVSVTYFPIES